MKIWVLSQVLLNEQDLSILHWVTFLIKDWEKKKPNKKEGLLKRLKNIEDKNKEQVDEIKCQGER